MKNEKQPTSPTYRDITSADVKACSGYEDLSDETAQKLADAIRVYTEILYNCFCGRKFAEQEAKVISLNRETINKAA